MNLLWLFALGSLAAVYSSTVSLLTGLQSTLTSDSQKYIINGLLIIN